MRNAMQSSQVYFVQKGRSDPPDTELGQSTQAPKVMIRDELALSKYTFMSQSKWDEMDDGVKNECKYYLETIGNEA